MSEEQKKTRRTLSGVVVSAKMDKSIVVCVTSKRKHPMGKYITRSTKVYAHDEDNTCHEGDTVLVSQSRPLSKKKSWVLVEIIEKAV
jgi:small subunit ribosomal protein S17